MQTKIFVVICLLRQHAGEPEGKRRHIGDQQQYYQRNREKRQAGLERTAHTGIAQFGSHQQRHTNRRSDAADVNIDAGQNSELDEINAEGVDQS